MAKKGLLSIKVPVFVDRVAKIWVLSIKVPVFVDRKIVVSNNFEYTGYAESKEQCRDKEQEGFV